MLVFEPDSQDIWIFGMKCIRIEEEEEDDGKKKEVEGDKVIILKNIVYI